MDKKRFALVLSLVIGLALNHCTRNPVGDNKIQQKNLSVSGTVHLSDAAAPAGVFVWLEGFRLSAVTDSAGQFRLQLPPPETQPGGGLSGMFKLYYYVANYKYVISTLAIVDGSFVYGEKAIDKNGRIPRKNLQKLVDIETTVTPAVFPQDSAGYLHISVAFRHLTEPVDITAFENPSTGNLAGVIVKKTGAPEQEAQLILTSIWPATETIDRDIDWTMHLFSRDAVLSAGTIEIVPYIFIEQKDLPVELLQSIGLGYDKWHWNPDYLKIPMKQKTATCVITG
jgi:hypothetical protein